MKSQVLLCFVLTASGCGIFLENERADVASDGGIVDAINIDVGVRDVVRLDVSTAFDGGRPDGNIADVSGRDVSPSDAQGLQDVALADVALADVALDVVDLPDAFMPVDFEEGELAFSFDGFAEKAVINSGKRDKYYGSVQVNGDRFVRLEDGSRGISNGSIQLPPIEYNAGTALEHISFCATIELEADTTPGALYHLGNFNSGLEVRVEITPARRRLLLRHHTNPAADQDYFSEDLALGRHNFCFNFDGENMRYVLNGAAHSVAQPSNLGPRALSISTNNHRILANRPNVQFLFSGRLDNLRVWFNRAPLSDDEMRSVAFMPVPKPGAVFDLPLTVDDTLAQLRNEGVANLGNAFGEGNAFLANNSGRYSLDMRNNNQNLEFTSINIDDALMGQNASYAETTFALWIYSDGSDGVIYQFGSGSNCIKLSLFDSGPKLNGVIDNVRFDMDDQQEPLPVNLWTHLAITISPDEMVLYLDGVPRHQVAGVPRWQMLNQPEGLLFRVASNTNEHCSYNDGTRGFLSAILDNLRFYPYALSQSEVIGDMTR